MTMQSISQRVCAIYAERFPSANSGHLEQFFEKTNNLLPILENLSIYSFDGEIGDELMESVYAQSMLWHIFFQNIDSKIAHIQAMTDPIISRLQQPENLILCSDIDELEEVNRKFEAYLDQTNLFPQGLIQPMQVLADLNSEVAVIINEVLKLQIELCEVAKAFSEYTFFKINTLDFALSHTEGTHSKVIETAFTAQLAGLTMEAFERNKPDWADFAVELVNSLEGVDITQSDSQIEGAFTA